MSPPKHTPIHYSFAFFSRVATIIWIHIVKAANVFIRAEWAESTWQVEWLYASMNMAVWMIRNCACQELMATVAANKPNSAPNQKIRGFVFKFFKYLGRGFWNKLKQQSSNSILDFEDLVSACRGRMGIGGRACQLSLPCALLGILSLTWRGSRGCPKVLGGCCHLCRPPWCLK